MSQHSARINGGGQNFNLADWNFEIELPSSYEYDSDDSDYSYDSDSHASSCDCSVCRCRSLACQCPSCTLIKILENGDRFQAKKFIETEQVDVNVPILGEDKTPLMIACQLGHLNLVDMLVKDLKAEVDVANDYGKTALMFAAEAKMVKIVTALVNKYKAEVDAEDERGATALYYAIKARHVDVINVLVATCKANVEHGAGRLGTPLLVAILVGSVDIVNLLCNRHKANVNAQNSGGETGLMVACQRGDVEIVQALAGRHKARVDVRSEDGMMALHFAAQEGNHEIVDMLIGKYGADVEAKGERGWTALRYAVECEALETAQVLVNKYGASTMAVDEGGMTPLDVAKDITWDENFIKVLSDRSFVVFVRARGEGDTVDKKTGGEDGSKSDENQGDVRLRINASTKAQRLVDAFCAKKGWKAEDIVFSFKGKELIITESTTIGDIGLKEDDCIDASLEISLEDLRLAIAKEDIAEIKRIGSLKVLDLNTSQGDPGVTPLMHSIYLDKPKALVALLELGADVDGPSEKGLTPLMVATQAKGPNSVSIVRELIEYKAHLEAADQEKGWTAVFWAVDSDSVKIAKVLISSGASLSTIDKAGKTPLDYAHERGNQKMVELLEAAELKPDGPVPASAPAEGGGKGEAPSVEEATMLASECEEDEISRKQREEEEARKLADEEEARNQKFAEEARKRAEEARKRAEEEAQQAKERAVYEEVQRKAAAEEKARIEASKAQKRAEEEERRRKLEEQQAAMRKRDMALKKALEKEEKSLRKQKKKEAEQEAKAKRQALVQEKEDHIKIKAEPRKVLRRPSNEASTSPDAVNQTDPVELLIKFAAEGDMLNITSLINNQKVDTNARHPKTGITAVMAAARHGRWSAVKSLVRKCARIESVDNDGRTALMHAILGNQPTMVRHLVEYYRADLSATDNSGETPISMAENLGFDTIVELLKAHQDRMAQIREPGKQTSPVKMIVEPNFSLVREKSDRPQMNGRHGLSHREDRGRDRPKDAELELSSHHHLVRMPSRGGFFGDLDADTGLLEHGLDGVLEDGLDAPPEELLPGEEMYDPIVNGRDEWLQQSMLGLDINSGVHDTEDVMEDLLKEVNNITIESYDEINLVAEDAPLPFSNVGLGGLLTSAPAAPNNLGSETGFIEGINGSSLFGPMPLTPNERPKPAVPPPVPMTAREIESRLRKPPGVDRSPSKSDASVRDQEKEREREREREWTKVLEEKVEKLESSRTDAEKRLKTLNKVCDGLRKQVSNQDKRLAAYDRRMKSMEQKLDKLLGLVKSRSSEGPATNSPHRSSASALL